MKSSNTRLTILSIIDSVIQGLVDLPHYVEVDMEVKELITIYKISTHKDDMASLVGKGDVYYTALEVLVNAIAENHKLKILLVLEQ